MCIRYRGNLSTEPLASNDRGIFIEPSRYLATIWGDTHTDTQTDGRDFLFRPLRWAQVPSTKFHKDWLGGYTDTHINKHTHTQTATWSHKLTLFFQNKESRLIMISSQISRPEQLFLSNQWLDPCKNTAVSRRPCCCELRPQRSCWHDTHALCDQSETAVSALVLAA
jgi:hypothetical protein